MANNFRVASAQDVALLQHLIQSANADVFIRKKLKKEENPSHPAFISQHRLVEEMKAFCFIILAHEGVPVGCVAYREKGDLIYLNRLSVLPSEQGNGFAKKLIYFVQQKGEEIGATAISIGINGDDTFLCHWYQKQGFVIHEKKQFEHISFPVYMMRFKIS